MSNQWMKARALSTPQKVLAFIILMMLLFMLGLFVGYGIIGDGKILEVLDFDTWSHIFNFTK